MSQLFLVRHAQASFGAENYDKLSELGHQQSIWLGEYWAQRELDFDSVWRGDMVRHRETLEGVKKGLVNHPEFSRLSQAIDDVTVTSDLNEYDFRSIVAAFAKKHPELMPKSEKPSKAEFYKVFKNAYNQWQMGELDSVGESFADFEMRVMHFKNNLQQEHAGKKVLVITSGGVISLLGSYMLKTDPEMVVELNMQTRNSSIAHCYFNHEMLRLSTFNHVPHLDTKERQDKITYS